MNRNLNRLIAMTLWVLGSGNAVHAQAVPSTILQIEVDNFVQYYDDTTDFSKLATVPGITTGTPALNFRRWMQVGDIVSVNGQPVKGTFTANARQLTQGPAATPGQAISDTTRNNFQDVVYEILKADGTPIGSIMALGLGNGSAPPGAPLAITQGNNAIQGGTGAFLGVRGMWGQTVTSQTISPRAASMTEDPFNRIQNGGGRAFLVLHLIPVEAPQVVTTPAAPAITHADFSPVTGAKPAKAGEVLIIQATGLGPTVPGVDPGQPFPSDVTQTVNSPLNVSVNGKAAQVINAIGWPGLVDTYRVDIQVPNGLASGMAAVQLTAAWIPGAAVSIPVQ